MPSPETLKAMTPQNIFETVKLGGMAILLMILYVYHQDTTKREDRNFEATEKREERYLMLSEAATQVLAKQSAESANQAQIMRELTAAIRSLESEIKAK
jgi:hypothetical protein